MRVEEGLVDIKEKGNTMIEYTHDKNGCHYIGLMRGKDSVAYSKELYEHEDGSWVLADIGHDGKLIGVDIRMEDEDTPCCVGGCACEEGGENKEPCDACKEQAAATCDCCKADSEAGVQSETPCVCCEEVSNG